MTGEIKNHKNLEVWKRSTELTKALYEITAGFPQAEMYDLTSQIRRAAVSIPANIAEGAARNSSNEYSHLVSIAVGSAAELETLLYLSNQLKLLDRIGYDELSEELTVIVRMLTSLRQRLRPAA